ncbi:MAG: hypothetical protein HRU16_05205, partial [Planctomycetes bacterium]|nr:hypothetical protein [Planctomycetota bacterium]
MSSANQTVDRPWGPLEYDDSAATELARECQLHPVLARLLVQRGITTAQQANE